MFEALSSSADYKKGDRIIINISFSKENPIYYIVTVTKIKKPFSTYNHETKTVRIDPLQVWFQYDDGDVGLIDRRYTDVPIVDEQDENKIIKDDYEDIIGLADPDIKRKESFSDNDLDKFLYKKPEEPEEPEEPDEIDFDVENEQEESNTGELNNPMTYIQNFSEEDLEPPKKALIQDLFSTSWRVIHDANDKEIAIRKIGGRKNELEWIAKTDVIKIKEASEDDLQRDVYKHPKNIDAARIKDRRRDRHDRIFE